MPKSRSHDFCPQKPGLPSSLCFTTASTGATTQMPPPLRPPAGVSFRSPASNSNYQESETAWLSPHAHVPVPAGQDLGLSAWGSGLCLLSGQDGQESSKHTEGEVLDGHFHRVYVSEQQSLQPRGTEGLQTRKCCQTLTPICVRINPGN